MRGIVETIEQKSGLNALLYLDGIIGLPALVLYAYKGKSILLAFVWMPLLLTMLIYIVAFIIDRNFLRSEKHVKEMRQLEILGEKNREMPGLDMLGITSVENPAPKDDKKLGTGNDV